jgi:hypothetical protein
MLTVSEEKEKPVFDEHSLDKLLEAAFVLQEHNRSLRELDLKLQLKRDQVEATERASSRPAAAPRTETPPSIAPPSTTPADYTLTLGRIVETQHHIQVHKLGLDEAMALVAERVMEIGAATGAAIALLNGQNARYRAVAGLKTPAVETIVPAAKALCSDCVTTAQVVRRSEVSSLSQADTAECRRRGIQSLIVAPIFYEGEVAGALELYYSSPHAFTDQDVHTCQLMAGLITEALVREEEHAWKKSLATERAAMLDALEKLQPNLAALVEKSAVQSAAQKEEPAAAVSSVESAAYKCRKCGHQLLEKEQFCGECGLPRSGDYERPSMQSKVASLWELQESAKTDGNATSVPKEAASESTAPKPARSNFGVALAHPVASTPRTVANSEASLDTSLESKSTTDLLQSEHEENTLNQKAPEVEEEESSEDEPPRHRLTVPADWSSAAAAREFLEQLASGNRSRTLAQFWNARRGDIYLAVALILVACVIRWGVWSNHSITATGAQNPPVATHKKPAPDAGLSFFDRMLINLGLAEAPEPPEDKGNPSVQVWVDERTALYYCPGADLYGKTPKGKFTTQREAQLDQFEPAYRRACN